MSKKTPEILIPALRQYRHNFGSEEFLVGLDYDIVEQVVAQFELEKEMLEAKIKLMEHKAKISFNCFWNGGWYGIVSPTEETAPIQPEKQPWKTCHGHEWISGYYNQVKDCPDCNGENIIDKE